MLAFVLSVSGTFHRQAEAQTVLRGEGPAILIKKRLSNEASQHRRLIEKIAEKIYQKLSTDVLRYVDLDRKQFGDIVAYSEHKVDFAYVLVMEFEDAKMQGISLEITLRKVQRNQNSGATLGEPLYEWPFGFPIDLHARGLLRKTIMIRRIVQRTLQYESDAPRKDQRLVADCIFPLGEGNAESLDASQNLTVFYGVGLQLSTIGNSYVTKHISRDEWDYICSSEGLGEHPGRNGFGHSISGFLSKNRKRVELFWARESSRRIEATVILDSPVDDSTIDGATTEVINQIIQMDPSNTRVSENR